MAELFHQLAQVNMSVNRHGFIELQKILILTTAMLGRQAIRHSFESYIHMILITHHGILMGHNYPTFSEALLDKLSKNESDIEPADRQNIGQVHERLYVALERKWK